MPKCYVDGCSREATRLYEKEWGLWNIENDGNYAKSKRTLEIEIPSKDRQEYHLCSEHGDKFEKGEKGERVLGVIEGAEALRVTTKGVTSEPVVLVSTDLKDR